MVLGLHEGRNGTWQTVFGTPTQDRRRRRREDEVELTGVEGRGGDVGGTCEGGMNDGVELYRRENIWGGI